MRKLRSAENDTKNKKSKNKRTSHKKDNQGLVCEDFMTNLNTRAAINHHRLLITQSYRKQRFPISTEFPKMVHMCDSNNIRFMYTNEIAPKEGYSPFLPWFDGLQ